MSGKQAASLVLIGLFVVCVGFMLSASPAGAADKRSKDFAYTLQRTFGEFDRTSGWCDNATTTPTNIWASSEVPAELQGSAAALENRRAVRSVLIRHADGVNTSVPLCTRAGPNTGSSPTRVALTCVATAGSEQTNGQMLLSRGEGRSVNPAEMGVASTPETYVRASAGTVRYCVEVAWKS